MHRHFSAQSILPARSSIGAFPCLVPFSTDIFLLLRACLQICYLALRRVAPGYSLRPAGCGIARCPLNPAGHQHSLSRVAQINWEQRHLGYIGAWTEYSCSLPTNYTYSSPCCYAPAMRPPKVLPLKRSTLEMWFNSVLAPIHTGRHPYSWFAGCVRTVLSAVKSCGHTALAALRPGIRTGRRQSPKWGTCPSLSPRRASEGGATTVPPMEVHIILNENRLGERRESPQKGINWQAFRVCWLFVIGNPIPFFGWIADNEYYAALCRSP